MKKATIACLPLIAGLFFTGWIYSQTTVFINEFHYDNASTDVDEGVEVAGPAGTDLTGWKVMFYNGNGGVVYDSVVLSGTIPGQQNGFGSLWTAAPGSIQNGPDGIALVNAVRELIQLISYEGSFTASGGPASGLSSMDIGVEESGVTEIGQSLQLSGEGLVYEDFSWMANLPSTPGTINASQFPGSTSQSDTVPPEFTSGYPRAVNITEDRFDILLNLSEACTVYYIARMSNALSPDSLEIQSGDTLMVEGPGMDITLRIDTASPSSSYEIYFLAADHASPPNVMDTAVLLRVRTAGDTKLRLVSPLTRDTVYVGDSVIVAWTSSDIDSVGISMFDFRIGDWSPISGGGIPALDSTWKFYIPVDVGQDSMMLRIAGTRDSSLHAESGVICLVDTIIPKVIGLFPSNHATGIPLLPSLKMEFDERVYPGTGFIGVHGEYGGQIENINVTGDHIKYDREGYSVQIMLSSPLPFSGHYHVLVEPGAFVDYQGNLFGGFSADTNWIFTTIMPTGETGHMACRENPAENRIRIYPNPAEERITLEWYGNRPTNLEVEILGMKGVTVYRNNYHSIVKLQEMIDLQHLTDGIYMLKIRTGKGISVTWLVVQ